MICLQYLSIRNCRDYPVMKGVAEELRSAVHALSIPFECDLGLFYHVRKYFCEIVVIFQQLETFARFLISDQRNINRNVYISKTINLDDSRTHENVIEMDVICLVQ